MATRAQGIAASSTTPSRRARELLGFIPWNRVSTAYGYSQALDATLGAVPARDRKHLPPGRTDFADAVDFVGWYHAKTADTYGVARDDTFRLYMAYYAGWTGFKRGDWQGNAGVQRYARETRIQMAKNYAAQLRDCNR